MHWVEDSILLWATPEGVSELWVEVPHFRLLHPVR